MTLSSIAAGCSNGASDPINPSNTGDLTNPSNTGDPINPSNTGDLTNPLDADSSTVPNLWGYWDISIDPSTQEVVATSQRQAMFTANVVQYLNQNPALLKFKINSLKVNPDTIDIDLDISITHPFASLTQFNGYDVRGVFMGNGSASLGYNPKLKHPVENEDQYVMPNPSTGFGGPDGYTRWFNFTEFNTDQLPIVEYTPGIFASADFAGTATMCPYKYFADGLGATDDLWEWLDANGDQHGLFSAGSTNKRNYFIRFPKSIGLKFGYAVLANWAGTAPKFHPSNAREALALSVAIQPDLYYVDKDNKGGHLIFDVGIFDWSSEPVGGVMQDYRIFIESTVMSTWDKFTDNQPTGSGEHYYTYHFDITPDNLTGSGDQELWIIVDYAGYKYKNDFGVPNQCGNDLVAAAFRYDLYVNNKPYKTDPVCELKVDPSTPANQEVWDFEADAIDITFDATGSYDPDGTNLTYMWDFNGDSIYDGPEDTYTGNVDKPTHTYSGAFVGQVGLKLADENDGESECFVDVSVEIHLSKNLPLKAGTQAKDIAVDPTNGDLLVVYSDKTVYRYKYIDYYDPGDGIELVSLPPEIPTAEWIDVSEAGYIILGSPYRLANFTSDGEWVGVNYTPDDPAKDVWTLAGDGDLYSNDHCSIWGGSVPEYHYYYVGRMLEPNFNDVKTFHELTSSPQTGYDELYAGYIKAMEGDVSSKAMWSLEGSPDYYAARWGLPYLDYDGAHFGTGSANNNDDGFYNPLDMTRTGNTFLVLDKLSTGQPRVKGWDVDGTDVTSLGGFGDSTSISGTPLRIDADDYINIDGDRLIFVLHGSSPYMVSIFFPEDLPW